MDASEQINRFKDFFEENYKAEMLDLARLGKKFMGVDFPKLAMSDPGLAENLLHEPEEALRAAELAAESITEKPRFRIRLTNLPETQKVMIRNIRSKHLGKLISVNGIVRQKSDVRPQVIASKFECPSCGNIISVLQIEKFFKEPRRCGCGRKGKFRLISQELVDAQGLVLEEVPEELEGGEQPKRLNVFLKEDLVSPITEKRTNPGSKLKVLGQMKEVPIITRGAKQTRFDLILEANNVVPVEESFYDIAVSEEEEKEIQALANDPKIYEKLIASIAPSIYGYERIKEALILELLGGVRKQRKDGIVSRGDIHILLVGDPGAGKSQLLKRISIVAPKGRYVSGKGVTGAGITAAVVRDEFLGGWSLEAGALVLANNGVCCVDEMDKMNPDDRGAMHEALEQQTISISKANIQATLLARTTVLAAANPKFGRFDPYEIIANQIDMPPTLINRFDLIFPIKDVPDKDKDEKMAKHILGLHQSPDALEAEIPTDMLKKYISYARQKIKPKLTDAVLTDIRNFYIEMRSRGLTEERAARAVPISPRQLEALVRLAEASARSRLSQRVTKKDARRAISILTYCLLQVGLDRETGKLDIDRISTGIPASQRDKIFSVKDVLAELENRLGKTIPITDVLREATERGVSEEDVEEIIEKLKRSGDIYEPKSGFLSRI